MSIAINLNAILKQTIAITRENEDWSTEQIMTEILTNHVKIESLNSISVGGAAEKTAIKATKSDAAEKKTRTRAAPSKPRAIPEDDTRCYARSFYEKEHLEGNVLKVMRDDSENLYGDRCKFKKTGDSNFCKHHSEKQPLGIWGGEYSGKFKSWVEKTENPDTVVAATKPKPAAKLTLLDDDHSDDESEPTVSASSSSIFAAEDQEDEDEEEEEVKVAVKPAPKAAAAAASKPAPKIEEPAEEEPEAEVEECEIDGVSYLKDEDNIIYDPETEDVVGKYDFTNKKWVKKQQKQQKK